MESTEPTREELIELRDQRMTRKDIAKHYGVTIATVRRWVKTMGIPRPTGRSRPLRNERTSASGELIAPIDEGFNNMEIAARNLGSRLTEKRGLGYYLDGRPVRVDAILKAAGIAP